MKISSPCAISIMFKFYCFADIVVLHRLVECIGPVHIQIVEVAMGIVTKDVMVMKEMVMTGKETGVLEMMIGMVVVEIAIVGTMMSLMEEMDTGMMILGAVEAVMSMDPGTGVMIGKETMTGIHLGNGTFSFHFLG